VHERKRDTGLKNRNRHRELPFAWCHHPGVFSEQQPGQKRSGEAVEEVVLSIHSWCRALDSTALS
jgi:hypothetical protein